ncbi:MAG TPA: biotin--[acetyl-CoA-carboxylase] ligase [Flavobacteriaceae bacterium]|nr:biotin--[acetyl-CoA-carboxylase] ligase [Flavobacteriaceae bacterium]MCB9213613.1 biotin--[acetyl-CoA-carboxylase] ligase [Alteromonas sp.]HPF12114.1 biotin--[acetyl-CoA-carboxylase] ligase [Flavobacteriaceae bacterium]HQU21455.1 biotin--[acetyl-CoA-carboxylase] ligase [Flavobacteriaceae bacterium]HQU65605.1 biotin--[acetyl-CoA-carboxylase] ligase [Flavobacteriaceae bacterium]
MEIIKINAIGSTNDYLKQLSKNFSVSDGAVVWTLNQTQGRGQLGANWYFEIGKSLAFSVFKRFEGFSGTNQFFINFAVSLGVKRGLEQLGIPKITIKWPNDILADGKKVCGILVENQFLQQQLSHSVIGVGINVNNEGFRALPQASSLLLNTGVRYAVEEVLKKTAEAMAKEFDRLEDGDFDAVKQDYEIGLFRKGQISTFETSDRRRFNGVVEGVTSLGMLQVRVEGGAIQWFQTKDVKLLY